MIKNYFKSIFRQAVRNKLYTSINLLGLSVAIACCVIIFLFVQNEYKYDGFHKDEERIFRIVTKETDEGKTKEFAHSYLGFLPLLQAQWPEIEEGVRLLPQNVSVANKEKNIILQEKNFCFADSNFLDLFSFQLIQGDSKTALLEPNSLLITESIARKYFGKTDVIGKELVIEQSTPLKITGVLANIPAQSSLQFDMFAPMAAAKNIIGSWITDLNKTWHHPPIYSFVRFAAKENARKDLRSFEQKFLPGYVTKTRSHSFQELADIHFSAFENEPQPSISKKALYIFLAAGILILLIAAFNFINLFLARIIYRLRGIGIQKVLGAGNRHIWRQTFAESVFYLLAALLLSTIWISLFLPSFNLLMNRHLNFFSIGSYKTWMIVVLLLVFVGFLISVFPSFILSRFKLINILKGKNESLFPRKRVISFQSGFIIFQFVIAIALIISTMVMQSQAGYIRNKNLGLQKEHVLILPVRDNVVQENFNTVKNKLLQVNGVSGVSAISNFPWEKGYYDFETTVSKDGKQTIFNTSTLLVEEDFIAAMGMTVVKGRGFSKDFGTDSSRAFIMNETAAAQFGINDPAGVKLVMENVVSGEPKEGELIGIVKDFHLQSLHESVAPLILTVSPQSYYIDNIIVKLSTGNIPKALELIQSQLKEISPNRPFEYFFLDDAFDKLYQKETRMSSLFNYFAFIAIIIACLGLFGIVAFAAAQRIKEIGIRKVLGASIPGILGLLSKNFIMLVLVAAIIASPLAWYFMNMWLQDFVYRISIGWRVFIIAGSLAMVIAFITIAFQAIKAAMANPVKSLRTE